MTPEAGAFLDKAHDLLERAPLLLAANFADEAGRAAYLAGFHAAQALIFEKTGATFRTHSGVQTEFARLARNEPTMDTALRAFLGRAFNLKAIADYETGPGAHVSPAQASEAIVSAEAFVAAIETLIRP